MTMLPDDPILSPKAAAEFLGFSESWLTKQRGAHYGPAWIRLGAKKVGYRRSALRAWLEQCERDEPQRRRA